MSRSQRCYSCSNTSVPMPLPAREHITYYYVLITITKPFTTNCNLPTAYIIQAIPLYLNYFPAGECIIFIHSPYKSTILSTPLSTTDQRRLMCTAAGAAALQRWWWGWRALDDNIPETPKTLPSSMKINIFCIKIEHLQVGIFTIILQDHLQYAVLQLMNYTLRSSLKSLYIYFGLQKWSRWRMAVAPAALLCLTNNN